MSSVKQMPRYDWTYKIFTEKMLIKTKREGAEVMGSLSVLDGVLLPMTEIGKKGRGRQSLRLRHNSGKSQSG